jgi:ssDNA-binding Zn-finger/Zn-ribbon topoisomerase 1
MNMLYDSPFDYFCELGPSARANLAPELNELFEYQAADQHVAECPECGKYGIHLDDECEYCEYDPKACRDEPSLRFLNKEDCKAIEDVFTSNGHEVNAANLPMEFYTIFLTAMVREGWVVCQQCGNYRSMKVMTQGTFKPCAICKIQNDADARPKNLSTVAESIDQAHFEFEKVTGHGDQFKHTEAPGKTLGRASTGWANSKPAGTPVYVKNVEPVKDVQKKFGFMQDTPQAWHPHSVTSPTFNTPEAKALYDAICEEEDDSTD